MIDQIQTVYALLLFHFRKQISPIPVMCIRRFVTPYVRMIDVTPYRSTYGNRMCVSRKIDGFGIWDCEIDFEVAAKTWYLYNVD